MRDCSLPEDLARKREVGATIYCFLFDSGLLVKE
jgi:hypothetical protein